MEQRYVVESILKSGERLRLRCKEFKAHTNEGVLTGYEYSGSDNLNCLYIDISEIAAIVQPIGNKKPVSSCIGCKWEQDDACCCHGGRGWEPAACESEAAEA